MASVQSEWVEMAYKVHGFRIQERHHPLIYFSDKTGLIVFNKSDFPRKAGIFVHRRCPIQALLSLIPELFEFASKWGRLSCFYENQLIVGGNFTPSELLKIGDLFIHN